MYRILRVIKPLEKSSFVSCSRMLYSTTETTHTEKTKAVESTPDQFGGFAKAYERHGDIANPKEVVENYTFASLLRNSKLIDLGDPVGKTVIGKIFHTVGEDLYIDFGWKFHCVCTRPTNQPEEYVRGAKVRIQIKDLELSSRFLGSSTDLTLLEADCKLIGVVTSPTRTSTVDKQ